MKLITMRPKKNHPISLAIEETQIKIALRFHFSPVSLAITKITNENKIVGHSHCGDYSVPS